MNILKGNDIEIEWTINECDGSEKNFAGADVSVFVVNGFGRIPADFTINRNVITLKVKGNVLDVGNYSVEAIWTLNGENGRAVASDVFYITDDPNLVNSCQ